MQRHNVSVKWRRGRLRVCCVQTASSRLSGLRVRLSLVFGVTLTRLDAAPFFLVGSILWIVAPVLCWHGQPCSEVGVAAAACFLIDFTMLLLSGGDGIPLLMVSYGVYGIASISDLITAILDLHDEASFASFLIANISFCVAGILSGFVWIVRRQWLSAISSLCFFAGGAVYLFTDCDMCDVAAASLFMMDALINVFQLTRAEIRKRRVAAPVSMPSPKAETDALLDDPEH